MIQKTNVNTVEPYVNHEDTQTMERAMQDVAVQIILTECAEVKSEE